MSYSFKDLKAALLIEMQHRWVLRYDIVKISTESSKTLELNSDSGLLLNLIINGHSMELL